MNEQDKGWVKAQGKATGVGLEVFTDGKTFYLPFVMDWRGVLEYKSVMFIDMDRVQISGGKRRIYSSDPTQKEVEEKIIETFKKDCMGVRNLNGKIYDAVPSSFVYGQWR